MTALEFRSEYKSQREDRSLRVCVATERKLEAQEPLRGRGGAPWHKKDQGLYWELVGWTDRGNTGHILGHLFQY